MTALRSPIDSLQDRTKSGHLYSSSPLQRMAHPRFQFQRVALVDRVQAFGAPCRVMVRQITIERVQPPDPESPGELRFVGDPMLTGPVELSSLAIDGLRLPSLRLGDCVVFALELADGVTEAEWAIILETTEVG